MFNPYGSGLPIFRDACNYVSDEGFLLTDYFVVNGVIVEPQKYAGRIVRELAFIDDKVVVKTDKGDIVLDRNGSSIVVVKEGVRSSLKVYYEEGFPYVVVVPEIDIDYDELYETLRRVCLGD